MSEFKQKTITGVKWGILNNILIQSINMFVSILLARLLLPEDFGTVGMVMVITGFASVFFELGFGQALIQKDQLTQKDLSTVFWFNIFMGLLLAISLFLFSNQIAIFYNTPILQKLSKLFSLIFIFGSLNVVQLSVLKRNINFKKIAIINSLSTIISGSIAIILALNNFGIWAIATQILCLNGLKTLLYWISSKWLPKFIFSWPALKTMLGFSSSVTADSMLTYWARNLDNLLIGKFIGGASLGLYTKAYSIMMLPLNNISQVLTNVLFPSFSSIKNDIPKLKSVHLKILTVIILIVLPICCIIWLSAHEIVSILFGEKWLEMVPLVEVLTFLGVTQSLLKVNGSLYYALGKANLAFQIGLILKLNIVICISIGLYFGDILGLCYGYAIASTINFFPSFYFSGKLVKLKLKDFFRRCFPIIIIGIIMLLTTYFIQIYFSFDNIIINFIYKSVVAGTIYIALLTIFRVKIFIELISLIKSQIQKKSA